MRIINETHSKLVNEMLNRFNISEKAEDLTCREIVEKLLTKVNRGGIDKLLNFLSSHDYYTAPASTRFHGNYEGGLAEHSINVCALFIRENDMNNLGLSDETLIVSSLLHDLCKVDFYTTEIKNVKTYLTPENRKDYATYGVKRENVCGVEKEFAWVPTPAYSVNDQMPYGHGEKSVYMAMGFIKLTREEVFLIRWHMGPFSSVGQYDFNNAIDYQKSVVAIYVADMLASSLYEDKK